MVRFFDFITRCERRLASDGGTPTGRTRYVAFGLWVVCILGLGAAVKLTGFPVVWEKFGDVIVTLDSGWRVWNGQVPHRDFYSVIGPFPLAVFASGFALNHRDITGFPLALFLAGVIFSALSWRASQDRLTLWWRLVVSVLILLLPAAMAFQGGGEEFGSGKGPPFDFAWHTTYAMQYNRLGWAALLVQMLIMLIPRRSIGTARQADGDAALAGAMMALCIFCKINYSLVSLGLGFWWIVCNEDRSRRTMGLVAGLTLAAALLAIYPGGLAGYFLDNWRMLKVSRSESQLANLLERVRANLEWLLILPILHLSVIRGCKVLRVWYWTGNFFVAIMASMFVTMLNRQLGEIPGLLVAGLITVEMILRGWDPVIGEASSFGEGATMTKCLVLKICCVCLAFSAICYDAGSVFYALAWRIRKPGWADESERFTGLLAPLPVPIHFNEPTENSAVAQAITRRRSGPWLNTGLDNFMTTRQEARWINDGVELLKLHVKPTDRIFVAAWMNPFNLALGLPPAKGGAMLWDWDRFMDTRIHPDVRQTLADVTLFMVPKRADWTEQRDFMLKLYGQGLGTDFHVVGESQFWTCWGR